VARGRFALIDRLTPPDWLARLRRDVTSDVRALTPIVRRIGTVLLLVWFAWETHDRISYFLNHGFPVGIDARIYYRAVVAWLQGADPWSAAVEVGGWSYHFAGSPSTLVVLAPAGLLSEDVFTFGWLVLSWILAGWTLRRLRFPLWWLLFPPMAEALFSGNPQLAVLALLVANRSLTSGLATALKVYAFVPLLGETRWRQITIAIGVNVLTVVVAPTLWLQYIRLFGHISSRLEAESTKGGSAFYFPELLGITIAALVVLAVRDRRAAGWLAVPAVWPSSQFHYSTMALPVMTPFLAVFLALPVGHIAPLVIVLEVVRRVVQPHVVRLVRRIEADPPRAAPV
jgi:hypothetical protein